MYLLPLPKKKTRFFKVLPTFQMEISIWEEK